MVGKQRQECKDNSLRDSALQPHPEPLPYKYGRGAKRATTQHGLHTKRQVRGICKPMPQTYPHGTTQKHDNRIAQGASQKEKKKKEVSGGFPPEITDKP